MVRASQFTAEPGDETIAVHAARGGGACRIATATIAHGSGGSLRLTDWQIEPGFAHDPSVLESRTVHRLVKSG